MYNSMMLTNSNKKKLSINSDTLIELSFLMFFISPFLEIGFNFVFSKIGITEAGKLMTVLVIYLPFLLGLFLNPKKHFKLDVLIFLIAILFFFSVTYLLHPEYEPWYKREGYGAWDHVFFPTNGIYAYLFFRHVDDPKKVKNILKTAGYIMIIYFLYLIRAYLQNGYWIGVSGTDGYAKFDYSVSFGYDILFFLSFFIYDFIIEGKLINLLMTIVGVTAILLFGSRGPVLGIVVLILFSIIKKNTMGDKNAYKLLFISILFLLIFIFFDNIMNFIISILEKSNINSRFINNLKSGNILQDNGRSFIWDVTISKIKEQPLGYGFLGSRSYLSNIIYAGYPHNLFLEVLSDFGIIIGPIMIIYFIYNYIKLSFSKKFVDYASILISLSSCIAGLMISLTYWSRAYIWICLAIIINVKMLDGKGVKNE